MEDTRKTRPSESTQQGADELTETEASGLHGSNIYIKGISLVFLWE